MAKFMEHKMYDSCLLGINEKCAQFCFSTRSSNKFSMVHVMAMLPLILIFSLLRGTLPRKKYPPALLLPWDAVRYDASEWILSTISDALNWMIAFGLVCIYCKIYWTHCIVRSVGLACSAAMALRDNKIVRSTNLE